MSKTLTAEEFLNNKFNEMLEKYPNKGISVHQLMEDYADYVLKITVKSKLAMMRFKTNQADKKGKERVDLLIEIEQKLLSND